MILVCISTTGLAQTQPGIYLSNYRAKKVIIQLEERDYYKELYMLKKQEVDTLRTIIVYKDLIITDLHSQVDNLSVMFSNSQRQSSNLTNIIAANDKEQKSTNKILYGTIAAAIIVLVFKK